MSRILQIPIILYVQLKITRCRPVTPDRRIRFRAYWNEQWLKLTALTWPNNVSIATSVTRNIPSIGWVVSSVAVSSYRSIRVGNNKASFSFTSKIHLPRFSLRTQYGSLTKTIFRCKVCYYAKRAISLYFPLENKHIIIFYYYHLHTYFPNIYCVEGCFESTNAKYMEDFCVD